MSTYILTHHGIIGQKWGVRRYQNEDGSLTSAGEKRQKQAFSDSKKLADVSKTYIDSKRSLENHALKYEGNKIEKTEVYKKTIKDLKKFEKIHTLMKQKYGDVKVHVGSNNKVLNGMEGIEAIIVDKKWGGEQFASYVSLGYQTINKEAMK